MADNKIHIYLNYFVVLIFLVGFIAAYYNQPLIWLVLWIVGIVLALINLPGLTKLYAEKQAKTIKRDPILNFINSSGPLGWVVLFFVAFGLSIFFRYIISYLFGKGGQIRFIEALSSAVFITLLYWYYNRKRKELKETSS